MNNTYLENVIFFYIIKNLNLVQSFKGRYFTNPALKIIFDVVKPHILDFRAEPTEQQTIDLIRLAAKDDKVTEDQIHTLWQTRDMVSQYTDEWLEQNTVAFGEWQNLMTGLRRVIEYVKTTESEVTFENCAEIVQHIKSLCLKGGWANKTLNVFMGSPKVGKSMWLCNLCANSVRNGENSAYITLEMAYQLVAQRIGSNLFNIPIEEYDKYASDTNLMMQKMKEFYMNSLINPGKFIIEEFPTSSATVYDIESFLLKQEEELSTEDKPFKFKNIFIDYVNIMKDAKNPNSESTYLKIKSICEDVRAMAQRNNWCVVSLTQTNRTAYDSTDIGMSNVSESGGLIATVDSLFGIIQSSLMRVDNTYYLKAVAIRNSGHMGDKKKFDFNPTYLRIEENLEENIIPENVSLDGLVKDKHKGDNNYQHNNSNNYSSSVGIRPGASDSMSTPQLGLTETQIQAQDLFSM